MAAHPATMVAPGPNARAARHACCVLRACLSKGEEAGEPVELPRRAVTPLEALVRRLADVEHLLIGQGRGLTERRQLLVPGCRVSGSPGATGA